MARVDRVHVRSGPLRHVPGTVVEEGAERYMPNWTTTRVDAINATHAEEFFNAWNIFWRPAEEIVTTQKSFTGSQSMATLFSACLDTTSAVVSPEASSENRTMHTRSSAVVVNRARLRCFCAVRVVILRPG